MLDVLTLDVPALVDSRFTQPPGITVPGWVVIAISVAAATFIAVYLALKMQTGRINWIPLPVEGIGDVGYAGVVDDPARLARAFRAAATLLAPFYPEDVYAACVGARVYVVEVNAWVDLWGRKVAGSENGAWLSVGRNFAALAHEMAHLLDWRIGRRVGESEEAAHARWQVNGIQHAIDKFETWNVAAD